MYSPALEEILRQELAHICLDQDVLVRSCGVYRELDPSVHGMPAPALLREAMEEHGYDLNDHRAQLVCGMSPAEFRELQMADICFVFSKECGDYLAGTVGVLRDRIIELVEDETKLLDPLVEGGAEENYFDLVVDLITAVECDVLPKVTSGVFAW